MCRTTICEKDREKEPQQDGYEGQRWDTINLITSRWATHKLENNYSRGCPTGVAVLTPHQAAQPRGMAQGG